MRLIIIISIAIGLAFSLFACTSKPPQSTTTGSTFGSLAQAGQTVYEAKCASCHGSNGQGVDAPALWGANSHVSGHNTAEELLSFISTTMPANAPGTLTHQDYLNVLSYLLIQNNVVADNTTFDESRLSSISLK